VPVPSIRTALAAVGLGSLSLLTACGGGAAPSGGADGSIAVEAGDDACKVARTSANTGSVTFEVTNKGNKVTEFYVYGEGDRILGEVENIGPGLSRRLIVELPEAGKVQTACKPGMTGDGIRGDFTVQGENKKSTDGDAVLAEATKGYQRYVSSQADSLLTRTTEFAEAVKAGEVEDAKTLYPVARVHWERIEPVAESFGDLDPRIDARENDAASTGAEFTGYHRLERDLWTTGLQPDSAAIADRLVSDVSEIVAKAKAVEFTPVQLANGAKELLDEVSRKKVAGEEDRYSHTDLWDLWSNVEGSQAAIASLRPAIQQRQAALASTLDEKFKVVDTALQKHRKGDGYKLYTELSAAEVKEIAESVDALGEPVSKVAEVVSTK
jgi:iron uptake system component EfeO